MVAPPPFFRPTRLTDSTNSFKEYIYYYCKMFTCSNCGYNSTDKSNYLRHCNRKTACGPKKQAVNHGIRSIKHSTEPTEHNTCDTNHDTESVNQYKGHVNNTIEFDKDTHRGKCPRCERTISKKHIKKHIEICKGVPKNTCGVCFRIFSTQQSHSRHQKICKKKKEIHVTNSEEQMDMLLERLREDNDERLQVLQTELKKDYEHKIQLLQLLYDNDRAMMQELFNLKN